jgi:hypothetical protein
METAGWLGSNTGLIAVLGPPHVAGQFDGCKPGSVLPSVPCRASPINHPHVRMIGSDAPRGRKTANQLALQNPQTPAHEHSPELARRHMLSSMGT